MNQVTLTHKQFLNFTGWSEPHALKKTVTERMAKLTKMGMQEVTTNGKGKKANYTFFIPSEFWNLLLTPSMSYTAVGANYIKYLVEGRDVFETQEGTIVKFHSEITQELAETHNMGIEAVKTTCRRIRKHLIDCSYIRTDIDNRQKSHRVKKTSDGNWITGEDAFNYDQQARTHWTNFFRSNLAKYQKLEPEATKVPWYLLRDKATKLYRVDIARWLEVEYYRVTRRAYITDNIKNDINYARQAFLDTYNLAQVREELARRQNLYELEKQHRDEQKRLEKQQEKTSIPSKEERQKIKEMFNKVAVNEEYAATLWTAQDDELSRELDTVLHLFRDQTQELNSAEDIE
ncbi:hypothetical protein FC697_18505 [Bacillus wiedmannii]|uniref:hypothetical protein n=1 Tax=Bacillus wiedmannii TaxID=1890302 RepID=UPI0010BDD3E0|nr:hypothetical protein [Bacillus wiedmannii]TKH20278.1 hypothetical protein FC697_18505 [Bacillus wiedmannii]